MHTHHGRRRRLSRKPVALLIVALLFLGACSGGGDSAGEAAQSGGGGDGALEGVAEAGGGEQGEAAARPVDNQELPDVGSQALVKTGRVQLRTEEGEVAATSSDVLRVARQYDAEVADSSSRGVEGGENRAVLGLHVPAANFEELLAEVLSLGEVTQQQVRSEDAGQELVDLDARIRHLDAQIAVYLELLSEADGVRDLIAIQNQLSQLQLDREQAEGRLRYLEDRVAYSVLTVEVAGPDAAGPVARRWAGLVDLFLDGSYAGVRLVVVALAALWPLAMVGAVAFGVWALARRTRRTRPMEPAPDAA